MSNTVDSRVVEMRFDNKQFESNVATSMSTLDKLKEKLKLTESSKHLNEIGNASKNLDFTSAINGVSALEKRFSVLGIAGMTVIQNLTNSAIRLGGKLTNWFTGGIVQGGITRAMNLEKARFQLQGLLKDTKKVEAVMENVNASVDGTAYSLDQAAVVASMFAATGMEAGEKMEGALRAVAGTAAMTSADYQRVGLIFTQIAGQGRLMGNDLLQLSNLGINAAATLGEHFGKTEAEIRDMVSKGKISFEMFAEAMDSAFGEHAAKANVTFTGAMANVKAALARIGAEFVSPLVVENGPLVKFFNVLRERINEVKASIGPIAKTFTDFVSTITNAATKYLSKLDFSKPYKKFEGLERGFKKLSKTINNIISPVKKIKENVEKVTAPIDKATKSLKELGDIADDVILGKFGNGQERFDKLAKAGYNYCEVQNKVNEKLNCSVRYTKEQIAEQNKLLGSQKKTTSSTEKTEKATSKLTKAQKEQIKNLAKLNDEQLRNRGYTEEQIEAFHELRSAAEKIGMPLDEFIDKMDKINGRWLLIDSFKNIGKSIATIFKSMGSALSDVFSPLKAQGLFNLIASFHKLSTKLVITDEYADKLKRTFRGLFAAIDIVGRVLGGGLRIGLSIVGTILRAFGATTLDVTASLGDLIYKLDEWVKKNDPITKFIELLADKLGPIAVKVKEFIDSLKTDTNASENFKKIAEGLKSISDVVYRGFSKTLSAGLTLLTSVLGLFGTSVAGVLTKLAVLVKKFGDWLDKNTLITNSLTKIAEVIEHVINGISKCLSAFLALEPVKKTIENIKNAFASLGEAFDFDIEGTGLEKLYTFIDNFFTQLETWIKGLGGSETFKKGLNIVEGLASGMSKGIGLAIDVIKSISSAIINAFCGMFMINSPSKLFMSFGVNIIRGLVQGLSKFGFKPIDLIKTIAIKLITAFKSLLQINSPSLVFMSFGAFIMFGLLMGIKQYFPEVYDEIAGCIQSIFGMLKNMLENFDVQVGEVFVAGAIVSSLLLVKKALAIADKGELLKIAQTLTQPFSLIITTLNKFNTVLESIAEFNKAKAFEAKANAIKSIAIAIAILAGSVFLLSKVPLKDLGKALAAITILVGLIAALFAVTTKLDGIEQISFGKLSLIMVALGVTLLLFSKAIKRIAELDPGQSAMAVGEMMVLIAALAAFFKAFGKCIDPETAKNLDKAGIMLLKMSFAIGILAIVLKLMASLEWADMAKGGAVIVGTFAIFLTMLKLCKYISLNMDEAGSAILKMAFAIGILAIAIKLMAGLDWSYIAKGGAVIVGAFALFFTITKLSRIINKDINVASTAIIKMAAAILLLSIAITIVGSLKLWNVIKGGITITVFFTMFLAMIELCKQINKDINIAAKAIAKMSAAILLLSVSILLLSLLKVETVAKGALAISAFFAMFFVILKYTKTVNGDLDKAGSAIVKMSAAIILLSVSILLLSLLKPEKVIVGAMCISLLLSAFALICYSMKSLNINDNGLKSLTVMSIAIAVMAGALVALSFLDMSSIITATACLSAVMGMFALVSYTAQFAKGSLGSLIVITVAIGMIAGALYLIGNIPYENTLVAAKSLSLVLLALSGAFLICAAANSLSKTALLAMGGITLILVALVGIFAIMSEFDIQPSIEVATALSVLLLAMSGAIFILSKVGTAAGYALPGLGILLLAIVSIGAFITGVGALFNKFENLEGTLDKGIDILCKVAHGIGLFIGSIGGGILEGINSGLSSVGKTLSDFMVGLNPFLSGLKNVDPSMAEAAKNLALTILAITGAGILESIGGWITGDSSVTSFASKLKDFGLGIKAYADAVSGIDCEAISASAKAAKALTEVANNLPREGGVWQALAGQKDMASFGTKLVFFGLGMKNYADAVSGIDCEAISASAQAAKALTEVANNIPRDGGILQVLTGQQNMALFGEKLKAFGSGMKAYSESVSGLDCESIRVSAQAAKSLTEVTNNLPKEGGVWQVLSGSQDISLFGAKLKAFGKGMKDYSTQVAGIDTEAVIASAKAAKALTKVANNIPKDGGIWQKLTGNNNISSFGEKLVSFGNSMKGYGKAVAGIDSEAVSASAKAAKSVVSVVKSTEGISTGGVKKFVEAIDKLGEADMDSVASAFSGSQTTSKMVSAGVKMVKSVGSGIKSSSASVKSSAKSVANSVASSFKSQTGAMKSAGTSMINAAANSIKSGKGIASAAKSAAKKAADAMKSYKGFKSAGSNAVSGFCRGITENTFRAEARAKAMAEKAIKAARKALRERSPSRVFIEIGKYVSEGFAIGITKATGLAESASEAMAVRTMDIANNALSLLGNVIDSDMDVQPTIAPVVDLTNVEAGAGAINNLLGQDVMLGASANLSAINYGMSRNQNGVNDDVVSAINKLRKDLGNISGDTYQINGVTYDDGSNITDAVHTLVRAAKVERRK